MDYREWNKIIVELSRIKNSMELVLEDKKIMIDINGWYNQVDNLRNHCILERDKTIAGSQFLHIEGQGNTYD